MSGNGLPVEKLRQFLRELKPGARALLVSELERGILRGDDMPAADLVLQELRRVIRDTGRQSQRVGNLARLFFQPLEPFLVDDNADHKHEGRIARVALDPIWQWISRDLMPGEAKAISEEVGQALLDNEVRRSEQLARGFQDRVVVRIQEALKATESDEKARRRLSAQIGTPRGINDVRAVLGVLRARDALEAISGQLPGHIKNLADERLDATKALLDSPLASSPEVFLYALVLVMSRLGASWQLVRLAIRAAGSDAASRIAETRYGIAVSIVLAEMERMPGELKSDLKSGRGIAVIALLKDIHDAVRGLRTELDLPADSAWGRQLSGLRAEIAGMLKAEIESVPGRVRRMLRPRDAKDVRPGSSLDVAEIAETESMIEFVAACRNYASELAVNELTLRTLSELQQYLDTGTRALLDSLRHASPGERPMRQSQVDAAVRFCGKVFGKEYASLLTKAAEVAAGVERKPVRA